MVVRRSHSQSRFCGSSRSRYSAQIIYANNYQTIPLLIVASLWYLLMTTILSFFQTKL